MFNLNTFTILATADANLKPLSGKPTADFYQSWVDYLTPTSHIFLNIVEYIMHGIALLFYNLANGVNDAWKAAWKLADFSQIFTSSSRDYSGSVSGTTKTIFNSYNLGSLVKIALVVGFVLLAVMMSVQMVQYSLSGGKKGKDWPKGVAVSLMILALLPTGLSSMMKIAQGVNQEVSVKVSPVDQLWKNNTVSLIKLEKNNFKVNISDPDQVSPFAGLPLDKNKANEKMEGIIKGSQFTETIDDIDKEAKKPVFMNKVDDDGKVQKLASGSWATGKTFSETYPVIKANWIGIIGGEIVFIIVGFLAIVELLTRFFRLSYYTLSILYFALRDIHGKKAVQLLQLMEGSITGMAMMPIGLILFYAWIQFGFNVIHGLSWWPFTILSIGILLAGYKGLMGGLSLIDEWTGTQSGHGNAMQTVAGAAMAGKAITDAGKSLTGSAKNGLAGFHEKFKAAGAKNNQVVNGGKSGNSGANDSLKDLSSSPAFKEKAAAIANAAGKGTGLAQNAKNVPGAATNAGKDAIKNKADSINQKINGFGNDMKDSYKDGQNSINDFINKNSEASGPKSGNPEEDKTSAENQKINDEIMGAGASNSDGTENMQQQPNENQHNIDKLNELVTGEPGAGNDQNNNLPTDDQFGNDFSNNQPNISQNENPVNENLASSDSDGDSNMDVKNDYLNSESSEPSGVAQDLSQNQQSLSKDQDDQESNNEFDKQIEDFSYSDYK